MRLRVTSGDTTFFELFDKMAAKVQEGADGLLDLLEDYRDLDRKSRRLLEIEHQGDGLTHEIFQRLNTTFVTPFDREDIHELASSLDDVLDHIEATVEFLALYKIEKPLPQMISLARTLAEAGRRTAEAMPRLRKMKDLEEYWVDINRLEHEGDKAYRRTLADLFSGQYEPMEVMKFKEIVEEVEEAIDRLEDVANTIESIYLKSS
ncbi:MAG: DUF47 domain-containing protein [Actinomycetota bacterium]